jgi:hypothetical protein
VRIARQRMPRLPRVVAVRPHPGAGGLLEGEEGSGAGQWGHASAREGTQGAAERPTVSGRAAGPARKKNRGGARKGEEGADVRAPVAEGGGECGEKERALGLRSRGSGPAHGPCGGERERGESGPRAGEGNGLPFLFLFFFPFSFLHSNIQTKLFEFK